VTMQNPRFLSAEDESTLRPLETAIDVALLDTKSEVCVLRGGQVEHPRYAGQRLFGAVCLGVVAGKQIEKYVGVDESFGALHRITER